VSLLVDDALVASWIRQGLPSDPTSIGNGTILVNSERWPLMMDPQLQGVLWIKEREAKNGLQVGCEGGGAWVLLLAQQGG
jgi:dynein heavy chain